MLTPGFDDVPLAPASTACGEPFSISAAPVLPPLLEFADIPLEASLIGDFKVASGGPNRGAVSAEGPVPASGIEDLIVARGDFRRYNRRPLDLRMRSNEDKSPVRSARTVLLSWSCDPPPCIRLDRLRNLGVDEKRRPIGGQGNSAGTSNHPVRYKSRGLSWYSIVEEGIT